MTTRRQLLAALSRLAFVLCVVFCLSSCSYLKFASLQAEYTRIQNAEPGQLNAKHKIDRETYFVYGRSIDDKHRYVGIPKAISAFSSKYRPNERVDTMFFEVSGSHFGLNLPEGRFDLLILADIDGDGTFQQSEVVGKRSIDMSVDTAPDKVLGQVDLYLTEPSTADWPISIDAPDTRARSDSLFFPSGTIRTLDDPIFDNGFSTLGMYDPASFLEQAPTMFYALEEDIAYKIPVVLVHGIGGSAREFTTFVSKLDRTRYKPWFYHYPSGADLDQMAELFYEIFLSGKVYRSGGMPMIVIAHSMGGLIAREAINRYEGRPRENQVHLLVTIATPFGGHSAARTGENHGLLVLPSWRDLNPDSPFIAHLFRNPLPDFVNHELIYAYQDTGSIKIGENSDGVVALSSQLSPQAQRQASRQFGFNNTHTDILHSEEVAAYIRDCMDTVKNHFPPAQLQLLRQGGYDVPLGEEYSASARYSIKTYGKYLMALTNGTLPPFHADEERFIAVVKGQKAPRDDAEEGWLRFLREYPELVDNN